MTPKDKFVLVLNVFELLSCITGILYYRKLKDTKWRWFVAFLVFTFATEMVAKYMNFQFGKGSGNFIYRYLNLPVTFLFFLWLFYKWFERSKYQQIAVAGMIMYILAWSTEEIFFNRSNFYFGTLSYQMAAIFLLFLSVVYCRTVIKSQNGINYQQDLMFWVVTGVMIFYFVNMPFNALRNYLYEKNENLFYIYWYGGLILNCLMYTLFIIGIKWGSPNTSYSTYSLLSPSSS